MMKKVADGFIQVVVPTNEKGYLFMDILEHSNCVIQKYYWRSKMDPEIIEEIEPKIFDAFNMVIIGKGSMLNLISSCITCNERYEKIQSLPSTYIPLTQEEITDLSRKVLTL